MKEYFKLQYTIANRRLRDLGVNPVVGYMLFLVCFVGFSWMLFSKTVLAPYVYLFFSFSLTFKLGEANRNDFLKMCFSRKDYRLVRLLENLTAAVPFAVFLNCRHQFLPLAVLMVVSAMLSLLSSRRIFRFAPPTPFYQRPFEFTVGFRKTWYLLAGAYCLTVIAIAVSNMNLAIFSLLLVFFIVYSYYVQPETEYYIWVHHLSTKRFLAAKIKTGWIFSSLLCLPVLVVLLVFYFRYAEVILLCLLAGYIYLAVVILAKYSAYPEEMNLPQVFLIAVSIVFPPLLLFVIPYLFQQAVKRLQKLLA